MKNKNEIPTNQDQVDQSAPDTPPAQERKLQAVSEPPKKTLTGFAKAWVIIWFIGNLAATCAPANQLSNSSLGSIVALVMLLSGIVAAGYLLLYYKNPIGLYMILIANFLGVLMNGMKASGYSVSIQTGLIMGIITYFVTRKQVAYPFGKSAVNQ